MHNKTLEEARAYLATLSREELCEFMIAESQNLLDKLDQVSKKAEETSSTPTPLLASTKKKVEGILDEEYFNALCTLSKP